MSDTKMELADTRELTAVNSKFSLAPRNMTEAMEFAKLMAASEVVPKQYQGKPANIIIAVQLGQEIGLPPLRALQFIAVINGNPCVWGQGCASLIVSSKHCEYLKMPQADEIKRLKKAVVVAKRRGHPESVGTFDEADAKMMKLDQKDTYIKDWPDMYLWRAFHRATKITFSDVLNGIVPREMSEDYETVATTAEGVEIMRPVRRSEPTFTSVNNTAASPSVDDFTKETAPPPPQIDRSKLVKVMIHDSVQKNGGGKTFYVLSFEGTSGGKLEASTFDSKQHDLAISCKGSFALIETKKVQKGDKTYTNLVYIEKAADEVDVPPTGEREAGMEG